ncbi:CinA family protein [Microbacterium sp. NPDC055910]|uniref:CinA family protein n=1 Tax=Microbacterium sp. NPDC055910 TaxID=3345659 RepID=UPI0035D7EE7F
MPHIDRLSRLARDRGVTLAVAESLTSGKLAGTVGAGENASEWFAGGVVAYFTSVKESVLGVEPGVDPCSGACAEQLARGVQQLMDADIAVSTTGVGGPDIDGGHPPGTVHIGWATRDDVGSLALKLPGDPAAVLEATVDRAVEALTRLVAGERP